MPEWSNDNLRLGEAACRLGLLSAAQWETVRTAGAPADAAERASTDAAVGGTLVRVLIEEGLIDLDGADTLRDAVESGTLDQLLADPGDKPQTATAATASDDDDLDDGFDEEFSDDEYEEEDDEESGSGSTDESGETDDAIDLDERRPGSGSSGRGWLAGLADSDSDDPANRRKTARVATVSGKINVRPASAISSPDSSDDDMGSVKVATPPTATGPTGPQTGAARDPFTGSSQIGPYILLEIIKHIGDTVMFKARNSQTGELAALKVLALPADDPRVVRFMADAASAASLHHPQIAELQVHGSDNDGRRHYAAVDFIGDARPLDALPHMDSRAAATLVRRLALSVHEAHVGGRVHGRLRPGCVLVDPVGEPHITGFVFPGGQAGDDPAAGDPPFHPYMLYASPELVRTDRSRVDARSDVFSLGAILYRLLTDDVPWNADTPAEYRRKVTSEDAMPPRQLDPSIPRGLELVCQRAMSREPAQRYATASELGEDLQRWLDGREVMARPQRVTQRMQAIVAGQPRMAIGGMLIGAIAVVVLLVIGVVLALTAGNVGPDNDNDNTRRANNNARSLPANGSAADNSNAPDPAIAAELAARRASATAALGALPEDVDDPFVSREELAAMLEPLKAVCAADPSWSVSEYWLGRAMERSGRIDEAVGHYAHAATLDPPCPPADLQALMLMAFSQDAAADAPLPRAADVHRSRLLALDPAYPANRAKRLLAEAIPGLLRGSPESPRDLRPGADEPTATQQLLTQAHDALADVPENASASAALRADVLTVRGYALGGVFPRGNTMVDRRGGETGHEPTRPAEALVALEDSLRVDPLAPGPHAVIGLHREAFGQAQAAVGALQHALTLRPAWPAAMYALARALALNGQQKDALWKMQDLTALVKDNPEYWRYSGTLQILSGEWGQAEQMLTRSLEEARDPHVQFLRALVRTQIPTPIQPGQPHPARQDLEQVVRDPTTTWNRDKDMMFRLSPDERAELRVAIDNAHDYFAMPPHIKVLIKLMPERWRYVWQTVTKRSWSPALGELLDVLDADPDRRAALRAGLEQIGRDESNPLIGNLTLDEWLTPARLQRMLHEEQLLEQRRAQSLTQAELYARACARFRVGRNYHGAYDDLTAAIGMVNPGGTGDQLMARLYFARSAVKLNSGDPSMLRDEMTRWSEAVAPRLADLHWAIKLDRLLTTNWRIDPDYERLWQ